MALNDILAWLPPDATDQILQLLGFFPVGIALGLLAWFVTFMWHAIMKLFKV